MWSQPQACPPYTPPRTPALGEAARQPQRSLTPRPEVTDPTERTERSATPFAWEKGDQWPHRVAYRRSLTPRRGQKDGRGSLTLQGLPGGHWPLWMGFRRSSIRIMLENLRLESAYSDHLILNRENFSLYVTIYVLEDQALIHRNAGISSLISRFFIFLPLITHYKNWTCVNQQICY